MSGEDRLNEKPKRRRGLRRQTEEAAAVASAEEEMDEEALDGDEEDDSSERGLSERKGRATPSRRTQEIEVAQPQGNFITRAFNNMREYIEGVRSEQDKIVWPTREETRRLTSIVLSVTIASALVLGAISLIFNVILDAGLKSPGLVFGVLFVAVVVAFVYYLRISNRRTGSF